MTTHESHEPLADVTQIETVGIAVGISLRDDLKKRLAVFLNAPKPQGDTGLPSGERAELLGC